jgi:hypothetical protein
MALLPLNTFKTKTAVLTTSTYNAANCARDTGLIVDSIAFDILYSGTTQSRFSGLQYWAQGASKIPGETLQTLAALDRAKEVAKQLVINQTVSVSPGNGETQIVDLPSGGVNGQSKIAAEFDLISRIIENGTKGVTDLIEPNKEQTTDTDLLNSAAILYANRGFLQSEIIAYVNSQFNTFSYNKTDCARDTRLIVDSIAFDLLTDGSTQSIFSGLQYWSQGSTQVPDQSAQTLAAIARIKTVAQNVIRNIEVIPTDGNDESQFIGNNAEGNLASVTLVGGLFDVITGIITAGTSAVTDQVIPNGERSQIEGIINAYTLLQNNKRFIQEEVIAWITKQISDNTGLGGIWDGFTYDQEKCFRDAGYIIDSVSFDLLFGGNRQSIQAGVYYYGFSTTTSVFPTQRSVAVTAFNYLRSILDEVIEGNPVAGKYQTAVKQRTNLPPGTLNNSEIAKTKIDIITGMIENGPDTSVREAINVNYTADRDRENAYRMLLANRDFLAAEVVAFVDSQTRGSFSYDVSLCSRDVGYIVDCIRFDILWGGNRQAVQAGVYYYDHSATISLVPTEKVDTVNAYNYLKDVIASIVSLTKFPTPLQTEVLQVTNLPAAYIDSTDGYILTQINQKIDIITGIISAGPSAAPGAAAPIDLTGLSTDPKINKAFDLLLANRDFLVAEAVAYLKSLNTPNTTKIYTAPPGITAIILMAQVANVSDTAAKVTFGHYRRLPVFADPSTQNGYQAGDTLTELVKEFTVPPNDSATVINGKMILESFDSVIAYASRSGALKITLSILETANA